MLIFAESWENVTMSSDGPARGWTFGNNIGVSSNGGRNGGRCPYRQAGSGGTLYRIINHGAGLIRTAFWFKVVSAPTEDWIAYWDNNAGTQAGGFKLGTDGKIRAYSWGTTPGLLATGAINIVTGNYTYIETEACFADAGSMKCWVNGILDITFSGDTLAAGTVAKDRARYYIKENGSYIDDILIWDDTGSGLTGNLGGKAYTMTVLRPTSDVTADFTRSTGANNYGNVDEAVLATADYNDSGTAGNTDLYGFADTGLSGVSILGVVVEAAVSNPGGGTINCKLLSDIGGTTDEGASKVAPASPDILQELFATRPGGGAWTPADVDAARFGIKLV